jgi:1-aminocyclopropane-1-carboxylate deaminase/D-cysteine desulfhydrase-like pyridoxal-dependent ACC family enzyme
LRLGLPEATALQGISIARDARRIENDAATYLERYVSANKTEGSDTGSAHRPLGRMQVDDAHRMGGFGRTEPDLMRLSRELTERSGVEFDPIYTAKAYAGMCATLNRQENPGHETIVFWHTGPQTNAVNPIPPNPIAPNPV